MTDIIKFPEPPKSSYVGAEFIGPFQEEWKVCYEGFRVPNLSAIVCKNGNIILSCDERFLIEGTEDEVKKWLGFISQCMAVSAGYSCHGENSVKDPNPFKVRMTGLGEVPK